MDLKPLFDPSAQRILAAVGQNGPMRFTQLVEWTGLDSKAITHELKALDDESVIFVRTIPNQSTRLLLEYGLTPAGEALYSILVSMKQDIIDREKILGVETVQEFHKIFHRR